MRGGTGSHVGGVWLAKGGMWESPPFFKSSNLLIWFLFQSIRSWFVRIFIIELSHYIECISKSLRIISNFIFIVFFSFDKKLNSTIIFTSVENIIHFSLFFVIYNYRRRELIDLFREWIFERLSQKIKMKNVKNLDWLEQLNLIRSINDFDDRIRFDHFVIELFRKSIRDNVFDWDSYQIFYFIFDIFSMFVCIDHLFFLRFFHVFCNKLSDFVHFFLGWSYEMKWNGVFFHSRRKWSRILLHFMLHNQGME